MRGTGLKSSPPYKVCIAGAGVLGLAAAAVLARRGVGVLLVDPRLGFPNASSVAAGLLAPVGEALFDPAAAPHAALLRAARGLWDDFAADVAIALATDGALIPAALIGEAEALGARLQRRDEWAWVADDIQVADPAAALARMEAAVVHAGGRIERRAVRAEDWSTHDAVVLAAGAQSPGLIAAAPELAQLQPVKGQIAVLPHGPKAGPTLRWAGGYLAPQASGARVGATMEVSRADTEVEPAAIAGLIAAARVHAPGLDATAAHGQAGVRMQTPDGLPLVGPSTAPRTLIAAGARRNGWLLAPLVASMIAAYCRGEAAGPWAQSLHPGRFR